MDMPDLPKGMQGQYNQALFQQIRLHELWTRIERMNANLLLFSPVFNLYHYEVVFNDLSTIMKIVYPKLGDADKKVMDNQREMIRTMIIKNKIYEVVYKHNKKWTRFNSSSWEKISKELFKFELDIEMISDKHGLGNPNKDDPNKAILNMG